MTAQRLLARWLWRISKAFERASNALMHHPFNPRRIVCHECKRSVVTLCEHTLSYPYQGGEQRVCRRCYNATPF